MRRQHAGVNDVRGHPATGECAAELIIEWQCALVDPIEAP